MKKNTLKIYNLAILILLIGFIIPFSIKAEEEGNLDTPYYDQVYESEVGGGEVVNTINTSNTDTSSSPNISDNGQITYELLEQSLPGIPNKTNDIGEYLGGIFSLAIGIASALAVLMIVIGGFKYMTSEAVSYKTAAKTQIIDAVLGLVMVLASWLILNTINEDLVGFNLNIDPVEIQQNNTSSTNTNNSEDLIDCWCSSAGGVKSCKTTNPNSSYFVHSKVLAENCK